MTDAQSTDVKASYDDPWKESLDIYFEEFLSFFFADVHALIDWSRGYESLEKEFQQFIVEGELGKRFTDKLFKVWRLDGETTWILVHVEVQSQPDSDFAERMFIYNYRCFDRYRKPVISLAVLGDERPNWRPDSFHYGLARCRMGLEFPIVKLLDYEAQWAELESSRNPITIMVMAHLRTKATTNQPQQRKQWKWILIRKLFEQGYSRENVIELFRLVDWMMTLPDVLEQELRGELRQYQEEQGMPYITSVERLAKEEGRQEGLLQGERSLLLLLLNQKFTTLPETITAQINRLKVAQLESLAIALQGFSTLGDLEQWLAQLPPSENGSNPG